MQDTASFWTDIKNLEEQLSKTPDSYCFARLSDVYLKVGLIDDALHVARQGVTKHPGYLAGQRSLALACHAKGLHDETLLALHLVVASLPEDVLSQKLLGRLSVDAGNLDAAVKAFRTALEFVPDDIECRLELEHLERSAREAEPDEDDDEIIEDLEILEEIDILEEDEPETELLAGATPLESDFSAVSSHDPLSTGTLAELYVTQGFIQKALEIYQAILVDNPADSVTAERITELKEIIAGRSDSGLSIEDSFEMEAEAEAETETETEAETEAETDAEAETETETIFSLPPEESHMEPEPVALPDSTVSQLENQQPEEDVFWHENAVPVETPRGVADNTVVVLDGWLENIRRIKSCR